MDFSTFLLFQASDLVHWVFVEELFAFPAQAFLLFLACLDQEVDRNLYSTLHPCSMYHSSDTYVECSSQDPLNDQPQN